MKINLCNVLMLQKYSFYNILLQFDIKKDPGGWSIYRRKASFPLNCILAVTFWFSWRYKICSQSHLKWAVTICNKPTLSSKNNIITLNYQVHLTENRIISNEIFLGHRELEQLETKVNSLVSILLSRQYCGAS